MDNENALADTAPRAVGSGLLLRIPTFHKPVEDGGGGSAAALRQKLREEARTVFLQRKSQQLMENEELQELWTLLEKHASKPVEAAGGSSIIQRINFTDFMMVAALAKPKAQGYFTPRIFAYLQNGDPHGRIPIIDFFNYVMRKVWLQQMRIALSLYDFAGHGFLRETDLENYILELIPTLPQLACLDASFHSFYVCTAVRRFFFFLDPLRTGRVRIQDIMACGYLDDLLQLRDQDELPKEALESNWFSPTSAMRVYGEYLALDEDHNGMLSRRELAHYGTGALTDLFVDRVFQECLTYEGEMDYKTYLDFVLALENKSEPASIKFLFQILDLDRCGHLNAFTINYFFRGIQENITQRGLDPVAFHDVKDEIFDMVKPANPDRIDLKDLLSAGCGGTVLGMLIDSDCFWSYENREIVLLEAATQAAAAAASSPNSPSPTEAS